MDLNERTELKDDEIFDLLIEKDDSTIHRIITAGMKMLKFDPQQQWCCHMNDPEIQTLLTRRATDRSHADHRDVLANVALPILERIVEAATAIDHDDIYWSNEIESDQVDCKTEWPFESPTIDTVSDNQIQSLLLSYRPNELSGFASVAQELIDNSADAAA